MKNNTPSPRFLARLLLGTAVFWLMGLLSVGAQNPRDIALNVEMGYEGYVKSNTWAPIRIQARNQGQAVTGRLQLRTDYPGETYTQDLSLPAQSQKEVVMYVPIRGSRLTLEFVDEEGELLSGDILNLRSVSPTAYMVGVISPDPALLNYLASLQTVNSGEVLVVAHIDLEHLPTHPEALSALNGLVFNDVDTSTLSPAQQVVLLNWVQNGGDLIIGGGPNAVATAAGLTDLLPASNFNPATLEDLPALADYVGRDLPNVGPYLAALPANITGRVTIGTTEEPLLVQQVVGQGQVYYFALDFGLAPMNGWAGNTDFWEKMLDPLFGEPPYYADYDVIQRLNDSLANINVAGLPSPWVFLAYLTAYIFTLVPLNYFILARLKRLEWSWFTIPLLVLLFSLMGYIAGFRSRGLNTIVRQVSVIQQSSFSQQASVDTFIGLYSPSRNAYTLRFDDSLLVQPTQSNNGFSGVKTTAGAPTTIHYGPQTEFRNLWTDVGTMSTLAAHGQIAAVPVTAGFNVRQTDGNWFINGYVNNQTDGVLRDVMVFVGDFGVRLNTIPQGESEIIQTLEPLNVYAYGDQTLWGEYYYQIDDPSIISRDQIVRGIFWSQAVMQSSYAMTMPVNSLFGRNSIALVGWLDDAPPLPNVEIEGSRIQTKNDTLLIYRTPFIYQQLEQSRQLPANLLATPSQPPQAITQP